MGGGKGDIDRYVAVVTPGRILYEVTGVVDELVIDAFNKAGAKMPFKTKIVKKEGVGQ
jgi:large subunit ribosomal protein L16